MNGVFLSINLCMFRNFRLFIFLLNIELNFFGGICIDIIEIKIYV